MSPSDHETRHVHGADSRTDRRTSSRADGRRTAPYLAAGLAVPLVLLTGCSWSEGSSRSKVILLVGDSIFEQSSDDLMLALVQRGWLPVIDARGGTELEPGQNGFDWAPRIKQLVATVDPDVAVVELGTNDCFDPERFPERLSERIDDVMRSLAGVDTVLWLTLPTLSCSPSVSAQLRDAAQRWGHLRALDASSHFSGHPEWIADDRIHLSRAGQRELGSFVRDAVTGALRRDVQDATARSRPRRAP